VIEKRTTMKTTRRENVLAAALMGVLTPVTAMLTFSLPRTNVLLGCVHLLLFRRLSHAHVRSLSVPKCRRLEQRKPSAPLLRNQPNAASRAGV